LYGSSYKKICLATFSGANKSIEQPGIIVKLNEPMKTLLLLLFSQAFLTSVQAQITPPSQLKLSEKFRLQPRKLGRVLTSVAGPEQQQLASGSTYRSQPHTLRIVVPSAENEASKMPQAVTQATEAPGGVRQLPLQQYQPEQSADKLEGNFAPQDKHSGGKP
jgi:hypothetical protein